MYRQIDEFSDYFSWATRQQDIEDIIDDIAAGGYRAASATYQETIFNCHNFDSDSLTDDEIEYMEREIEKRM